MGLSKSIMTRWPVVKGLIAGTTSQTGNIENLVPEQSQEAYYSCNISDFPINALLLESNDFILYEDGKIIGAE